MPNWVYNKVNISGKESEIDKLMAYVKSDDSDFDFKKIVPPPNTSAYNAECSGDKINDPDNWYNWNVKNWGTKWGACELDEVYRDHNDRIIYNFNTAWAAPIPVIKKLSKKFPSLNIELRWEEEQFESLDDMGSPEADDYAGTLVFKGGKLISDCKGKKCRSCGKRA